MADKFALILANTEYNDPGLAQLFAPGQDAKELARVLKSPNIGGFTNVESLINKDSSTIMESVETFFIPKRKTDDLLLLYFSGHGVRETYGSLYFAVRNTKLNLLHSTAIEAEFIRRVMDKSPSRRKILILDCCNSGAFEKGTKASINDSMGTSVLDGYGRVVLTASDSTQFAWEGENLIGNDNRNSVFTHFLIKGIEGGADKNGNGQISVDDLYDYVFYNVTNATDYRQKPVKFTKDQQGNAILIRESQRIKDLQKLKLPNDLGSRLGNDSVSVRLEAIFQIVNMLERADTEMLEVLLSALELTSNDDSNRVASASRDALENFRSNQSKRLLAKRNEEKAKNNREVELKRLADEKADADRKAELKQLADEKAETYRKAELKRLADEKAEANRKAELKRLADEKAEIERNAEQQQLADAKAKADRKAELKRLAEEKDALDRKLEREVSPDVRLLHQMGYAQVLPRKLNGFSSFAISFSIICILASGISAFPAAFNAVGPGGTFFVWLIGGAIAMSVALGIGQIASSFPSAGGVYHWSSHLGGRAWGWATAWFNLVGLICIVSSVDVLLYSVFFRGILLTDTLKVDTSAWGYWHQFVFLVLVLASQALINHYGIKLTIRWTNFGSYLIIILCVVLILALFAFSPVSLDMSRIFRFTNFTGDVGGAVVPFRTESIAFAFLLGLVYVCYTITGFDVAAHTAEETEDAQVNVPRGMWQAVFWSWLIGLVAVAAFVLTMPSIEEGAAAGWGSFNYMWSASFMPQWLKIFLAVGLVVVNYICGLAALTSTSRMMFAFSRDGGLPGSKILAMINVTHRTPSYAIWTSAVLALLSTVYAPYYLVLAVACAVFLYLSMVMPMVAGLFAEGGSRWKEKGPFNLRSLSKPNAMIAVIGGIVLAITGFFPPNEKVFYLMIGVITVMVIFWFVFERNRFQGIPEGDKIRERQKMIADIEKKYGEA